MRSCRINSEYCERACVHVCARMKVSAGNPHISPSRNTVRSYSFSPWRKRMPMSPGKKICGLLLLLCVSQSTFCLLQVILLCIKRHQKPPGCPIPPPNSLTHLCLVSVFVYVHMPSKKSIHRNYIFHHLSCVCVKIKIYSTISFFF